MAGVLLSSLRSEELLQLVIVDQSGQESSLNDAVVRMELVCRGCRYNLYGLAASGKCPECGLDISETIIHTVDPASSHLPKITNPKAVGNGFFWLLVCLFIASLILIARPLALRFDALDKTGVRNYSVHTSPGLSIVAAVVILLGLVAAARFIPKKGNETSGVIRRDIRLLMMGMIGLGVFSLVSSWLGWMFVASWITSLSRIALMISAIIILFGLKGILKAIGQRSREYRTARGGRQGIRAMMAAMFAAITGETIKAVAVGLGRFSTVETLAMVVTWMSVLMLLIGLVYLIVNGWWIRKALCKPPPKLRTILSPRADWDVRD